MAGQNHEELRLPRLDLCFHQQEDNCVLDVHDQRRPVGSQLFKLGGDHIHWPNEHVNQFTSEWRLRQVLRLALSIAVHLQDRLFHLLIHKANLRDWREVHVLRVPVAIDFTSKLPNKVLRLHNSHLICLLKFVIVWQLRHEGKEQRLVHVRMYRHQEQLQSGNSLPTHWRLHLQSQLQTFEDRQQKCHQTLYCPTISRHPLSDESWLVHHCRSPYLIPVHQSYHCLRQITQLERYSNHYSTGCLHHWSLWFHFQGRLCRCWTRLLILIHQQNRICHRSHLLQLLRLRPWNR